MGKLEIFDDRKGFACMNNTRFSTKHNRILGNGIDPFPFLGPFLLAPF